MNKRTQDLKVKTESMKKTQTEGNLEIKKNLATRTGTSEATE